MDKSVPDILTYELVVDHIFQYLSVCELVIVQRVCKAWKDCSKRTLALRHKVPRAEVLTSLSITEDEDSDRPDADEVLKRDFSAWKNEWKTIPSLLLGGIWNVDSERRYPNVSSDWLPNDCVSVTLDQVGLVCTDSDKADVEEDPCIDSRLDFCNLLALRPVDKPEYAALTDGMEQNLFTSQLKQMLSETSTKLVLIFDNDYKDSPIDGMKSEIKAALEKGVVVMGSKTENPIILLNHLEKVESEAKTIAISFKGENVKAASVFFDFEDIASVKLIFDCLTDLKTAVDNFSTACTTHANSMSKRGYCSACNSQTIGFLMCLCHFPTENYTRGDNDPRPLCFNQEEDAFRTVFPNVPLFGCMHSEENFGDSVNLLTNNRKRADIFEPEVGVTYAILVLR